MRLKALLNLPTISTANLAKKYCDAVASKHGGSVTALHSWKQKPKPSKLWQAAFDSLGKADGAQALTLAPATAPAPAPAPLPSQRPPLADVTNQTDGGAAAAAAAKVGSKRSHDEYQTVALGGFIGGSVFGQTLEELPQTEFEQLVADLPATSES